MRTIAEVSIHDEACRSARVRAATQAVVGLAALVGMALSTPALAQEGQACAWSVGTAANYAVPSRSFSLLTPEGSWSITPVLSTQCAPFGDHRWRPWAGVDAVPTLQHRYRRLAERGSMFVLARMGMDRRVTPRSHVGLHLTTNTAAWGFGTRFRHLMPPQRRPGIRGFDFRLDLLAGERPDLQASLVVHFHHRWVGNRSEEANLEAADWVQARAWHAGAGFEIGTITGFRFEVTPGYVGYTPEIGVRLGALTNLFAEAAVQPIALGHVDLPLAAEAVVQPQAVLHAGVTRRDGKANPIFGAAFELDPPEVAFQIHLGMLVGIDEGRAWPSIDAGLGAVW